LELLELIKCLVSKVLGRWLIVLNALQVADDLLGVGLLLVNYALQHIELLVDLLVYFILEAFLIQYFELHLLAFTEVI